jgi:hypothetical protein
MRAVDASQHMEQMKGKISLSVMCFGYTARLAVFAERLIGAAVWKVAQTSMTHCAEKK